MTDSDSITEQAARATSATHENIDSLYDAEYDDTLIVRDSAHRIWTAFETEYGDWLAVRARDEDDPGDSDWRPIGPVDISTLPFPLTVIRANEALTNAAPATEDEAAEVVTEWGVEHSQGRVFMEFGRALTEAQARRMAAEFASRDDRRQRHVREKVRLVIRQVTPWREVAR